jgi:four helix bundle protein
MSGIQRFEDLIAWQKARMLARAIYEVSQCGRFAKDFGLRGQIQRAAVSIMSNIAEGYERDRTNDYHDCLTIAKASCAEVRSQLYLAFDIGYLDQTQFDTPLSQTEEAGRIIAGLRTSISRYRNT